MARFFAKEVYGGCGSSEPHPPCIGSQSQPPALPGAKEILWRGEE